MLCAHYVGLATGLKEHIGHFRRSANMASMDKDRGESYLWGWERGVRDKKDGVRREGGKRSDERKVRNCFCVYWCHVVYLCSQPW